MTRTKTGRPPTRTGPYGETGPAGVRLTTEGRGLLGDWLAEWPHPRRLLRKKYPALYGAARVGMAPDEIDNVCRLGAAAAMARFDPARGVRFTGYALLWMRHEVQRVAQRKNDRVEAHRAGRRLVSGSAPCGPEGGWCLLDGASYRTDVPTAEAAQGREFRQLARGVLRRREPDPRRRMAFALRFGLDGDVPLTLEQVAAAFGLTRERIRQFQSQTLERCLLDLSKLLA